MVKEKIELHEEFMKNNFVVCPYCDYNNKVEKFVKFGTCLNCKKIIDDRIYFRNTLGIEIRKKLKGEKWQIFMLYTKVKSLF